MRFVNQSFLTVLRTASSGDLVLEDGAKHARVRSLKSRDWLPIPGSPSDHRAIKNFRSALHRLASDGRGFIFAKTGHLPA